MPQVPLLGANISTAKIKGRLKGRKGQNVAQPVILPLYMYSTSVAKALSWWFIFNSLDTHTIIIIFIVILVGALNIVLQSVDANKHDYFGRTEIELNS